MKYLITLITFASFSLQASSVQTLLKGPGVLLQEDHKTLTITGTHFKTTITKSACGEAALRFHKLDLENLNGKSFGLAAPGSLEVTVFNKQKKVSPASPLGQYIQNFDQKMITLKNEVNLACQKK